ncbi:MAG: thermonuclease family protein [Brevinematia bacterium]
MRKLVWILVAIFIFISCALSGVTITGKVVDVDDGDTVTVKANDGYYKVRLLSIDTPETRRNAKFKKDTTKVYINGEFNVFIRVPPSELLRIGETAKWKLHSLVYNKVVKVEIEGVDRYKRNLGWLWLDDVLINEYMVANGLARPYMVKGKYAWRIRQAESKAKKNKIGIYRY